MTRQPENAFWHFPDQPEVTYYGTVSIIDTDIILSLVDCPGTPEVPFTIFGITQKGKMITLLGCLSISRSMSIPGFFICEIDAKYALLGDLINADNCRFDTALVKLSDLDVWLDQQGFTSYESTERDVSLSYSTPSDISFYKDFEKEYSFIFKKNSPISSHLNNVSITQEAFVRIEHKSKLTIEDLWKDITQICSFLTMAYFGQPKIITVELANDESRVECLYRGKKATVKENKKHKLNYLFTYSFISEEFNTIFRNWTELGKISNPVIYALHEGFSDRPSLVEDKFLNIIQAIETFHRRTRLNEVIPKDEHKRNVAKILESCPEEYKQWLKEKLSYSNEPTLKDRISTLLTELDPLFISRFFADHESIVNIARNTRNYYTHYDQRLQKKALHGAELSILTQRLRIFLLICLLKQIGLPIGMLSKIIIEGSDFHFNHLVQFNQASSKINSAVNPN